MTPQVTVSVPYYRCAGTIRRAVESILSQSVRDLICVVINDGDTATPPWPWLAGITDPRLIRFNLPENRGRYFADAVTLTACTTTWWSPHDADDWSEPSRLARLLEASAGADVVLGAQTVHRLADGAPVYEPVEPWVRGDRRLSHHAHQAALWRTAWLRAVGGPHPGYRAGYDTLLTAIPWTAGTVRVVGEPLYHRVRRRGSLSVEPEYGMNSAARRKGIRQMRGLWRTITGLTAAGAPPGQIGGLIESTVDPLLRAEVTSAAGRLARLMRRTRRT